MLDVKISPFCCDNPDNLSRFRQGSCLRGLVKNNVHSRLTRKEMLSEEVRTINLYCSLS